MEDLKKASLPSSNTKVENVFATTQVFLPSKCKLYLKDSPLGSSDFIEIKEMTAREEDILTSKVLLKKGIAIDRVLESCIVDKKINHLDLLVGDRNTILLALRVLGYGPEYKVKVTCPVCNEVQDYEFRLDSVKMKMLDVEPVEQNKNLFEFILPRSGDVIKFKFLTANEENDLSKAAENFKRFTKTEEDHLVTSRMTRQIISINNNSNKDFINQYVENMPIKDARAFRDYVEKIEPNVELKSDFVCKNCSETSFIDIPMTSEFFWPTGN